ncbi:hypothetical protein JHW43_003912 [Diplocarpon mali]|nr:hypothetical protein JHW43_003912 [Diplocarpon mali]
MAPKRKAAKDMEMNTKRLAVVAGPEVEIQDQELELEEEKERPASRKQPSAQENMPRTDTSSYTVDFKLESDGLASQLMSPLHFVNGKLSMQPPTIPLPQVTNVAAASHQSAAQHSSFLPGPLRQENRPPLIRPGQNVDWYERTTQQQAYRSGALDRAVICLEAEMVTSLYESAIRSVSSLETASATDSSIAQSNINKDLNTDHNSKGFSAAQTVGINGNLRYGMPIPAMSSMLQIPRPLNSGFNSQSEYQPSLPRPRFLSRPHSQAQLDTNIQEITRFRGPQSKRGVQAQQPPRFGQETVSPLLQYPRYAPNQPNRPHSSYTPPRYPGNNRNNTTIPSSTSQPSDDRQQDIPSDLFRAYCFANDPPALFSPDHNRFYPEDWRSDSQYEEGGRRGQASASASEHKASTHPDPAVPSTVNDRQQKSLSGGIANASTSSAKRNFSLKRPLGNFTAIEKEKMTANASLSEPTVTILPADHPFLPNTQSQDGLNQNLSRILALLGPGLNDRLRAAGNHPSQFKNSLSKEIVYSFGTVDPAQLQCNGYLQNATHLNPRHNSGRIALQQEILAMELDQDPPGRALALLEPRYQSFNLQFERTSEEDCEMRLCDTVVQTLKSYNSAKSQQNARKADWQEAFRPAQYRQHFSQLLALEMMEQIRAKKPDSSLSTRGGQNRINGCSFCDYECAFGLSDSRFWLPVEASLGFCKECHNTTMSAASLWQTIYKLPHDMSTEAWAIHNNLATRLAEPPLKELGNELDFHAQALKEMGKVDRVSIIKHYRDERAHKQAPKTPSQIVRKTTVPGYPPKTPVQWQSNPPYLASGGIRSASGPGPSPLSQPPISSRNLGMSQAMQTSWKGGMPSHSQPMMSGFKQFRRPDGVSMVATNDYIRKSDRVVTPNGIEVAEIMGFAAIPSSLNAAASGSADVRKYGMSSAVMDISSGTSSGNHAAGFPPPSDSDSNKTQQSKYPTVSRTPPGKRLAGVQFPQRENYMCGNSLPGSSVNSNMDGHAPAPRPITRQQPPSFRGPGFCRGSPWRQVDFTKAKICSDCFIAKSDVMNHLRHIKFVLLSEVPGGGALGHDKVALQIGRVATDQVVRDKRYGNCMICTNQAIYGCVDCPLRVCVQCQVHLTAMCKGRLNNLLEFYSMRREHIRNDAFLLRSDGKGF